MATSWRLASRHRAPWRWVPPTGQVEDKGTAVRLKLRNPLSPFLDTGFLEAELHRHFQPLLDAGFDEMLGVHYHLALTVAMALAPLGAEPAQAHAFVSAFLARWGEALEREPRVRGRRRARR